MLIECSWLLYIFLYIVNTSHIYIIKVSAWLEYYFIYSFCIFFKFHCLYISQSVIQSHNTKDYKLIHVKPLIKHFFILLFVLKIDFGIFYYYTIKYFFVTIFQDYFFQLFFTFVLPIATLVIIILNLLKIYIKLTLLLNMYLSIAIYFF